MKEFMLDGKIALVTGASYGMGLEMAKLFAREGANIIITARGEARLNRALEAVKADLTPGKRAIGITADTGSYEDTVKVFDKIEEEFGDLDFLINNAGKGEMEIIDDVVEEHMMETLNINLAGPIRYCKQALERFFFKKNAGRIVNISSVNGKKPCAGIVYSATKAGLNNATMSLAFRTAFTNITVNAVAPGATITPAHLANLRGEQDGGEEWLKYAGPYFNYQVADTTPLDQAYACLYLCSEMGKSVTGQVIQVCNGSYLG